MGPVSGPRNRESVEGLADGVLLMALFGAVWGAAGAGALGGVAEVASFVASFALAAALCLGSVRLRRDARGLSRDDSTRARTRRKHLSRRFNLVFFLQGVAIVLAVVMLVRSGQESFVPAVVALIVGIHFFPLAALYRMRAYHITGAALCALALIAFLLAPTSRLPFVGLGSAAALFATAAYALFLGEQAARL